MFQFYLLSILLNALTGIVLISVGKNNTKDILKYDSDNIEQENQKKSRKKEAFKNVEKKISSSEIFSNQTFRLVVGILTCLVGFMKFFIVVKSGVIIFGDFFPAVAGVVGGFGVLFTYYKDKALPDAIPEVLETIFVKNVTIIGFVMLCVAVVHFVFPTALFI